MYVRKEGTHELTTLNRKVSVFEYVNGLALVVLCFRVGSNDDTVATATKKLLQKIFKVAASYGLIIRTSYVSEEQIKELFPSNRAIIRSINFEDFELDEDVFLSVMGV